MPSILARLTTPLARSANRRGLYLGRRAAGLHVRLYRASGGRIGAHLPGWPEVPIALVDHVGVRTGITRTSPLIFLRDGATIVIAASKAGQPTDPAWLRNLSAHPATTVQIGRDRGRFRARPATPAEHGRLWKGLVGTFPDFEFYRRQAAGRPIAILVLEPVPRGTSPTPEPAVREHPAPTNASTTPPRQSAPGAEPTGGAR
jgi:deazaflavin-dependent oxidoreductase (nitroreductase family)